ncbi:hypothetical protein ABZ746_18020 [Streptomyces sp. NPDC020096]
MSFPPPPNDAPPPGSGGGFGPPQGFGPPPPPGNGGYGQAPPGPTGFGGYGPGTPGGPAGPGGYGPGGPGGCGPYPPPPPGPNGGGNGPKVAGIVIGAVVVLAVVIGGIVWLGSSHSDKNSAAQDNGSASPSASSSPAPSDSATSDLPSENPSDGASLPGIPEPSASHHLTYVKLSPGDCFNSPSLDSHVQDITKVSCGSGHDGEVIANETLTGTISTEDDLKAKVLDLCEPDAKKRLESIPRDGQTYYNYALYPDLTTYQFQGENTVSCSLTLSNSMDGKQLTGPLP